MIRKLTAPTLLALLALMLFACSPTTETGPDVEPASAVEETEELTMAEEEIEDDEGMMAEEEGSHDEDMMDEDAHSDEVEAEEASDESMDEADSSPSVYVVNTADSTVTWTGAKAVGDSHSGGISLQEGSLTIADGQLMTGSFVLDMTSLTSADFGGDRLIGHLKSDDFFGVDVHPTAMLTIQSAELIDGDQYNVQADLTIKGITNPIEFVATASEADGQLTASADIVFDRAQFDVQYGSGSFFSGLGDDLINDEIEISVELIAAK